MSQAEIRLSYLLVYIGIEVESFVFFQSQVTRTAKSTIKPIHVTHPPQHGSH
jgi:hypothetical protein